MKMIMHLALFCSSLPSPQRGKREDERNYHLTEDLTTNLQA